jgi:hypothetical protein
MAILIARDLEQHDVTEIGHRVSPVEVTFRGELLRGIAWRWSRDSTRSPMKDY